MMFRSSDDSYDKERATNMSAVTAQLGDSARTMDTRESYEQTYNTGCNYASVGDWAAAEEALASAEKAAREYWEDEEDEVEEEVGIIKVQQGYVMQRQGRDKEAQTIYNQVLRNKPSDIGLTAVASNNLIAINKDQNIFDSKKRIKAATVEGLETKLNSTQRSAIARNNALLAMFTAQVDLCKQLLSALDTEDKDLITGLEEAKVTATDSSKQMAAGFAAPLDLHVDEYKNRQDVRVYLTHVAKRHAGTCGVGRSPRCASASHACRTRSHQSTERCTLREPGASTPARSRSA